VEHALSEAEDVYENLLGVVLNEANMDVVRRYAPGAPKPGPPIGNDIEQSRFWQLRALVWRHRNIGREDRGFPRCVERC
jgi:hypothetical protein